MDDKRRVKVEFAHEPVNPDCEEAEAEIAGLRAELAFQTKNAADAHQSRSEQFRRAADALEEVERLRAQLKIAEGALTEISRCGCSACGPAPSHLAHAQMMADDALIQMSVVE